MRSTLKIFLCIVSFCISGVSFAQDLNAKKRILNANERTRAKLLARGMSEQDARKTIARWDAAIAEKDARKEQTLRELARTQADASHGANRSAMDVSSTEKAALQALFTGNGGISWTNNSGWDFNTDVTSSWHGVTVTNGHVTGLNLANNNLINSLPAAIGQLTYLTSLNLSTNDLSGALPSQIGQLTALKYLYLDRNDFTGSIPTQIGQLTALLEFDMDYNNLTGSIPAEIGNLVALKEFSINQNPNLTGAIPTEMGNLVNMEYFYLISDNLTSMPASMGNMVNLKMMYITGNDNMTGQIPAGWGSATNMLRLQVDVNKLSGPIPTQLTNLSNLMALALGDNQLSGDVPNFTGLANLELLHTTQNKFRFIDFVDENAYYVSNIDNYWYSNQAKTDAVLTVSGAAGTSVTFEMSADGPPVRYTVNDQFQWYKGVYPSGTPISGATQRTYTIASLAPTHAGSYYCLSTHPQLTIPSDMRYNLVLVRNQITLSVTAAPALGACAEGFEGTTFPPPGWLKTNNGIGLTEEWEASPNFMCVGLGTQSAHVYRENIGAGNTAQDWLVTPKVSVPANGELRFFHRQQIIGDSGTTQYLIRVIPASQPQNNLGGYTTIVTYTENQLLQANCEEKAIDLSAYAGQDIYIAFVKSTFQATAATAGDGWMLDNVRVVSKCPSTSAITTSNIQQNSLLLSWTSTGAPKYKIEYGVSGFPLGTGTVVNSTTNSIMLSGLLAGTFYQFYVTPICNNCGDYPAVTVGPFNSSTLPQNYCAPPTNFAVTNYTGNTVTLSWTENGSATQWEIAYQFLGSGGGINPNTNATFVTVNQNPVTISGLYPDSNYLFYLRAKCGNGNSDWTKVFVGDPTHNGGNCIKENPEYANEIEHLFVNMVNELLTIVNGGGTIPNGYTSPAVVAMQPHITDLNAKIYNFTFVNGIVSFSFAPHAGAARKDVIIHKYGPSYGLLTNIDITYYFTSPNYYIDGAPAEFENSNSSISIKHIKFCNTENVPCTKGNPRSQQVTQLFISLLNHLHDMAANGTPIPDGYNCPQLMALAPYILDPNPRIYNFNPGSFSFSFHPIGEKEEPKYDVVIADWALQPGLTVVSIDMAPFHDPTEFTNITGLVIFNNGKKSEKAEVRHINFCPEDGGNDCPNPIVEQLYINLLNHLHEMVTNGIPVPDGYTCPELTALAPYITDANPAIYEFNSNPFHFSFHKPVEGEEHKYDVFFERWPVGPGTNIVNADLTAFVTPDTFMLSDVTLQDGSVIKETRIRHINFCPESTPDCSQMPLVNQLFINLLNHLHGVVAGGGSIPDGYTCPELMALAPYITDENPAIYNFVAEPFAFSFHQLRRGEMPRYDVLIEKWGYPGYDITSIDLANYSNPNDFTSLDEMITYADGKKPKTARVRHIDFCPDSGSDCSMMPAINHLFVELLNHLREVAAGNGNVIPDGYNCPELMALAPYITDPNPRIYNFNPDPFSFSFHQTIKGEDPKYDVYIEKWDFPAFGIASINLANFTSPEQFTSLNNMITLSNGAVLEKASVRHIDFCPDSDSDCSNMPMVNQLFINLLNHLHEYATGNGGTIPDGYDCPQLAALRPYITDPDARIYNFVDKPFSFSFHPIKDENPKYDVFIDKWDYYPAPPIATVNLANYTTPYDFTNLDAMITLVDGAVLGKASVRHIIFCPPTTIDCEIKPRIAKIFVELLNHLQKLVASGNADDIIDGYDCSELAELRPFLTDPDARIYNFNAEPFYFSFHPVNKNDNPPYDVFLSTWELTQPNSNIQSIDMANYAGPDVFTNLNFKVTLVNGHIIEQGKVRHINFCPEEVNYCISSNPRAAMVKNLFMALLNHLHTMAQNGTPVPDGYTCPQLVALTPYITDVEPKIYNFNPNEFSFSFHPVKYAGEHDVAAPQWSGINSNVTALDMNNYQSPVFFTSLDGKFKLQNGQLLSRAEVRHINFCPDDLCVNHVAIVVDESGSLDENEKIKIRRQLKNFIQQQADTNQATNGNMHISLIGMSDSDTNTRQDNKMVRKVLPGNIGDMLDWIDDYGLRYGNPGVTPGSDYWKSGLDVALNASKKPDMVIMITDGCQTGDVTGLKNTMAKFDNYHGNQGQSMPHLYVVGINNGFYVHNSTVQDQRLVASVGGTREGISRANDPNYNPSLSVESFTDEGNVTASLKLSLKYLLGLPNLAFPQESLNDFRADYFGHENFILIGSDPYYLSDRIILAKISCGTPSDQNPCDDCFSFQPEPDKSYILNAWVKEEHRTQVTNYPNPMIRLTFINSFKMPICWFDDVLQQEVCSMDVYTSGDIIEGWQRIVKKFKVPASTVYIDFELKNMSDDVPAFFDDIRIYPVNATMKSFVYDPENFKLMSELDENNYATYYEYDKEGGLIRIKKETSEGVKTIQETRSGNYLKVQQ